MKDFAKEHPWMVFFLVLSVLGTIKFIFFYKGFDALMKTERQREQAQEIPKPYMVVAKQ